MAVCPRIQQPGARSSASEFEHRPDARRWIQFKPNLIRVVPGDRRAIVAKHADPSGGDQPCLARDEHRAFKGDRHARAWRFAAMSVGRSGRFSGRG
jgi:hypothetical protein